MVRFPAGCYIDPDLGARLSDLECWILLTLLVYMAFGLWQIARIPGVLRYIKGQSFPDKDLPVSLMVPIHTVTDTLERSLRSFCQQDYPNFQLLLIIQNPKSESHKLAERLAADYGHVKVVPVTEPHDPTKCVAKSHNLLQGLKEATGEVYVFSDSDVPQQEDWLRRMVAPLGEERQGKRISASTAVFLMQAEGFWGNFSAIAVNQATVLSSFIDNKQEFPAFASGASVAVLAEVFKELKVEEAWANSFNDDLVLANTLVKGGHHVYNVRSLVTRPVEDFSNFKALWTKMRRWTITLHRYFHPSSRRLVWKLLASNFQAPVGFNLTFLFLILGLAGYLDSSVAFLALLFGISYLYAVGFRAAVAHIFHERKIMRYVWLTPVTFTIWGTLFLFLPYIYHSFTWGGIYYDIRNDKFREM